MRIGIIGLGLIGGSLGGAWRRAGHEVWGADIDSGVAREAAQHGFVDEVKGVDELAAGVRVIVLATPPSAIIEYVPRVAARAAPGAIISDVASVKRPVIAAMDRLESGRCAVGGHPVAGKETGGIGSATPDLFAGATYAVVPSTRSTPESIEVIRALARDVGARPIDIDDAGHDRVLARTSHLPQMLSSVLGASMVGEQASPFSGSGLNSMLRLASSDPGLWSEILIANADNVVDVTGEYIAHLQALTDSVKAGDADAVKAVIRSGQTAMA